MYQEVRFYSVFISSTFKDMQEERDYLNKFIFPALNKELIKQKIQLNIIDLRWGVDTCNLDEKQREEKVLKVCLDEIENSNPFFIVLLGNRYGWIPDQDRVKKALERFASEHEIDINLEDKSVTELEIDAGVFLNSRNLSSRFIFLRNDSSYKNIPIPSLSNYVDSKENKNKQERLKTKIIQFYNSKGLSQNIKNYSLEWDQAKKRFNRLEQFGEIVKKSILNEIEIRLKDEPKINLQSWCENEINRIKETCDENTIINSGRENIVQDIENFLLKNDNAGLLIGELGTGKSYLFSVLFNILSENKDVILLAFISDSSKKSIHFVLRLWSWQLANYLVSEGDSLEINAKRQMEQDKSSLKYDELIIEFERLINKASSKKKIIMLLDSIDELAQTPDVKFMTWLPVTWFKNVSLLTAVSPDSKVNALSQNLYLSEIEIPTLEPKDAKLIIEEYFKRKRKQLYSEVEYAILSKRYVETDQYAFQSPLWLNMICGIIDSIDAKDFEEIWESKYSTENDIVNYMKKLIEISSASPAGLFAQLADKAYKDIRMEFVIELLFLLANTNYGIRESDLVGMIVSWDQLIFSNLLLLLKDKLKFDKKSRILSFDHAAFKNAVLYNEILQRQGSKIIGGNISNVNPTEFYSMKLEDYLFSLPENDEFKHKELIHILVRNKNYSRIKEYLVLNILNETVRSELIKLLIDLNESELKDLISKTYKTDFIVKSDGKKLINRIKLFRFIFLFRIFLKEEFETEGDTSKNIIVLEAIIELLQRTKGRSIITRDLLNIERTIYMVQLCNLVNDSRKKLNVLLEARSSFSSFSGFLSIIYSIFFLYLINFQIVKAQIRLNQFSYKENNIKTGLKLIFLHFLPRVFSYMHLTKISTKLNGDISISKRERIKIFNKHFNMLGGLSNVMKSSVIQYEREKVKSKLKYAYCIGKEDISKFYYGNGYTNVASLFIKSILDDMSFSERSSSTEYELFARFMKVCTLYAQILYNQGRLDECQRYIEKTEEYCLKGVRMHPNDKKFRQWFRTLIETIIFCNGYELLGVNREKHQDMIIKWGNDSWLFEIGDEYFKKSDINKNEGFRWMLKAAEMNNHFAQYKIGLAFYEGDIVETDYTNAKSWFGKSCSNGNKSSMFNLGVMYHNGNGVEQSYSKALEYFLMAAENGYTSHFEIISKYYRKGMGTEINMDKAKYWADKAK